MMHHLCFSFSLVPRTLMGMTSLVPSAEELGLGRTILDKSYVRDFAIYCLALRFTGVAFRPVEGCDFLVGDTTAGRMTVGSGA